MDLLRSLSDAFRSIWVRFLPWWRGILSKSASTTELAAWLYIYIYANVNKTCMVYRCPSSMNRQQLGKRNSKYEIESVGLSTKYDS